MAPTDFDLTFKITQLDIENDVLVVQYHSSILKNPVGSYPEINIGTRLIDFERDVKEQLIAQCRGLVLEQYKKENKAPESEREGLEFLTNSLQKTITVEKCNPNAASAPVSISKIKFL
jgi:hypothetical protein